MKKCVWLLCICTSLGISRPLIMNAQSFEAQQLLLNVEKLLQLKEILNNMYEGYKTLHKGYTTIKDLSEANFNLHLAFLDGLLEVSPAVRKYKRVHDIVDYQIRIVKEGRNACNNFREDKSFTAEEVAYIEKTFRDLLSQSLKLLDELILVISAGKLRMSDDERLQAIDTIYSKMVDQYAFCKQFTSSTSLLSIQRRIEQVGVEVSRKLNQIK